MKKGLLSSESLSFNDIPFWDTTINRIKGSLVNFENDFITVNNNLVLSEGPKDGGIKVNRGSLEDTGIRWSERDKEWQVSNDGHTYYKIWNQGNFVGEQNTLVRFTENNSIVSSIIHERDDRVAVDGDVEDEIKFSVYGNARVKGNFNVQENTTLDGDLEVLQNTVIHGNLDVKGISTTIKTEVVKIDDNIIDLNANFTTGTPTEHAGISIIRGDLPNTTLRWNEDRDLWDMTTNGTDYFKLWTQENFDWTHRLNYFVKWADNKTLSPTILSEENGKLKIEGDLLITGRIDVEHNSTLKLYEGQARILVERQDNKTSELRWLEEKTQWEISEDGNVFYKVWHQGNLKGTKNYATRWVEDDLIGIGVVHDDGTNVILGGNVTVSDGFNTTLGLDSRLYFKSNQSLTPFMCWNDDTSHLVVGLKNNDNYNVWHQGIFDFIPEPNAVVRFHHEGNSSSPEYSLKKGIIYDDGSYVSIGTDIDFNYRLTVGGDGHYEGKLNINETLDVNIDSSGEAKLTVNKKDGSPKPAFKYTFDEKWKVSRNGINFFELWDKGNMVYKNGLLFVITD